LLDIVKKLLAGDKRALSRAISLVEDEDDSARDIVRELHPHTGQAHIIGVTGPPGVGKSTFVDALTAQYRKAGRTVGIVAVDPSSPFTGGALLGDRIRMQRHSLDHGVFVRSLATRGRVGGVSAATGAIARILDAAGKEIVIIETVGAGQSEVEIMKYAHSVVVVMAPGLGDDIQAIKAGILEIADLFVVNKADTEGAAKTARELEMALELRSPGGWRPKVLQTVARMDQGMAEVVTALAEHMAYLKSGQGWRERQVRSAEAELQEIVARRVMTEIFRGPHRTDSSSLIQMVADRLCDPYAAADRLLEIFFSTTKEKP
jgi:LAO/AO transport system kinase